MEEPLSSGATLKIKWAVGLLVLALLVVGLFLFCMSEKTDSHCSTKTSGHRDNSNLKIN